MTFFGDTWSSRLGEAIANGGGDVTVRPTDKLPSFEKPKAEEGEEA